MSEDKVKPERGRSSSTRTKGGDFVTSLAGNIANYYAFRDKKTNLIYIGKIVSKAFVTKSRQKEKISQEIQIHKTLDHKHIIGFHRYFLDEDNVYVILELCNRRDFVEVKASPPSPMRSGSGIPQPPASLRLPHQQAEARFLASENGKRLPVRPRFAAEGGGVRGPELYWSDEPATSQGLVPSQLQMISHEIQIHKTLDHKHIVGFHRYVLDEDNVYINLELCNRRGNFANYYEFRDKKTNLVYVGKIVSKAFVTKSRQKEKISQEIQIHKTLDHKHIIGFHRYFLDEDNVYINLELCNRRSLLEMHRRCLCLTEPNVRYFMRQLLLACQYLAQQRVIHRDLKLANLLLNDIMELKVGDFELSTRIEFAGQWNKSLSGTPNYIASEVLDKKGHSFEVDIWTIDCVLSTVLAGYPPYETPTLQETYARISSNDYYISSAVSSQAHVLIRRILQPKPEKRPNIPAIMQDDVIICGGAGSIHTAAANTH